MTTPTPIFIDTWAWLAIGHAAESRHTEALALYRLLRADSCRLVTSDYVLDELITLLYRRQPNVKSRDFVAAILNSWGQGELSIEQVDTARFMGAWMLRQHLGDKPKISFTDLTSMVNHAGNKNTASLYGRCPFRARWNGVHTCAGMIPNSRIALRHTKENGEMEARIGHYSVLLLAFAIPSFKTHGAETDAAKQIWGTLTGRFVYDGKPPEPRRFKLPRRYLDIEDRYAPDESLLVNPKPRRSGCA